MLVLFFSLMTLRPPSSTLFPYTTLFRSSFPVGVILPIVVQRWEMFGSEDCRAGRGADSSSDRKSTRLNSSHGYISYAVFCLKKKKKNESSLNILDIVKTNILFHRRLISQ